MTVRWTRLRRLAVGTVLASMTLLAACGEKNTYVAPPPPKVTVAAPVTKPVTRYLESTGNVAAVNTADLVARVSGFVQAIKYNDGDSVKKGQVLFVIEQKPYELKLQQAKAAEDNAKASLVSAQANYQRQADLVPSGSASKATLDNAVASQSLLPGDEILGVEAGNVRSELFDRLGQHRRVSFARLGGKQVGGVGDNPDELGILAQLGEQACSRGSIPDDVAGLWLHPEQHSGLGCRREEKVEFCAQIGPCLSARVVSMRQPHAVHISAAGAESHGGHAEFRRARDQLNGGKGVFSSLCRIRVNHVVAAGQPPQRDARVAELAANLVGIHQSPLLTTGNRR